MCLFFHGDFACVVRQKFSPVGSSQQLKVHFLWNAPFKALKLTQEDKRVCCVMWCVIRSLGHWLLRSSSIYCRRLTFLVGRATVFSILISHRTVYYNSRFTGDSPFVCCVIICNGPHSSLDDVWLANICVVCIEICYTIGLEIFAFRSQKLPENGSLRLHRDQSVFTSVYRSPVLLSLLCRSSYKR